MAKNVILETEGTDATKATAEDVSPKYSITKLRENCLQLFGISVSTFDGATYEMTGEYTVKEIKNTIEEWGKKEAK